MVRALEGRLAGLGASGQSAGCLARKADGYHSLPPGDIKNCTSSDTKISWSMPTTTYNGFRRPWVVARWTAGQIDLRQRNAGICKTNCTLWSTRAHDREPDRCRLMVFVGHVSCHLDVPGSKRRALYAHWKLAAAGSCWQLPLQNDVRPTQTQVSNEEALKPHWRPRPSSPIFLSR